MVSSQFLQDETDELSKFGMYTAFNIFSNSLSLNFNNSAVLKVFDSIVKIP